MTNKLAKWSNKFVTNGEMVKFIIILIGICTIGVYKAYRYIEDIKTFFHCKLLQFSNNITYDINHLTMAIKNRSEL